MSVKSPVRPETAQSEMTVNLSERESAHRGTSVRSTSIFLL